MTVRHGPRSRGAAGAFSRSPRRVLSAFVLGFALSAAGLAALASGVAGARGPFVPPDASASSDGGGYRAERDYERIAVVRYDGYAPRHRHAYGDEGYYPHRRHWAHSASIRFASLTATTPAAQPVCVRLCDGYFFPLPTSAGDAATQTSACNSLCPDAPTEVYYRSNAEHIEDSVSASGKLYSALPVSLRYRKTSEETCSCHRNTIAYAPMKDATLRRGDAIMTPAGFMVFHGVEGAPHGVADFTALDRAGLGSGERGALQALERASLTPVHPSLKDWLLTQNAPSRTQASTNASTQVAMRSSWQAPVVGGGKIRLMTTPSRNE